MNYNTTHYRPTTPADLEPDEPLYEAERDNEPVVIGTTTRPDSLINALQAWFKNYDFQLFTKPSEHCEKSTTLYVKPFDYQGQPWRQTEQELECFCCWYSLGVGAEQVANAEQEPTPTDVFGISRLALNNLNEKQIDTLRWLLEEGC